MTDAATETSTPQATLETVGKRFSEELFAQPAFQLRIAVLNDLKPLQSIVHFLWNAPGDSPTLPGEIARFHQCLSVTSKRTHNGIPHVKQELVAAHRHLELKPHDYRIQWETDRIWEDTAVETLDAALRRLHLGTGLFLDELSPHRQTKTAFREVLGELDVGSFERCCDASRQEVRHSLPPLSTVNPHGAPEDLETGDEETDSTDPEPHAEPELKPSHIRALKILRRLRAKSDRTRRTRLEIAQAIEPRSNETLVAKVMPYLAKCGYVDSMRHRARSGTRAGCFITELGLQRLGQEEALQKKPRRSKKGR